jgi:hypothetical protein
MGRAGRGSLVAAAGLCLAAVLAALAAGEEDKPAVVARDEGGRELVRFALPRDGRFALAYRNSVYGVAAEERFAARGDESFALVELAADRVAVLEEYYGVDGRPVASGEGERSAPRYRYRVRSPPEFRELRVFATELGQRTLVVGSTRAELSRLVPDGDVVVIAVESRK